MLGSNGQNRRHDVVTAIVVDGVVVVDVVVVASFT